MKWLISGIICSCHGHCGHGHGGCGCEGGEGSMVEDDGSCGVMAC
jgi:hypothetical protein